MPSFLSARPLIIAAAIVAIALPAVAQQAWRTHRDTKYGYQVDFPGVPSVTQETSPAGKAIDMAALEAGDNGVFLVTATDHGTPLDPSQSLDNAVSGALQGAGGKLSASADVVVDGFPARDVTIRADGRQQTIRARMVIRGSTFFQVMAVGPLDALPPQAERFVTSFRFKPPATVEAPAAEKPAEAATPATAEKPAAKPKAPEARKKAAPARKAAPKARRKKH
jgi:hypothetical protein